MQWDTAGQEKFHTITQSYYRGSHAIIVVYDCGSLDSFNSCKNWLNEIDHETNGNVVKILVANKCDREDRTVSTEAGQEFAESQNIYFIEVSAKNGININETFDYVINEVMKKLTLDTQSNGVNLDNKKKKKDKKC